MLFPTVEFALFFMLSLLVAWSSIGMHLAHKFSLLILSYIFYACWDWRYVPMLFGLSFLGWIATCGIQRGRTPRLWLGIGIAGSLALLGYYKYTGFLLQNLADLALLGGPPLPFSIESPLLPLGISFMTFHVISMMMDAIRGKLDEPVPLLDALLYVAFFPQLVAGPILRASTFLPQLRRTPDPSSIETSRALLLIAGGLFKKVVIANTLATVLVDDVFANPAAASASQTLLAIYGYATQIYCDFSGYTDIAIGCALLLGYRFPVNFNAPYTAASPQEFWRRWHISLSNWLRDYLYISFGGSKKGRWRTDFNLLITMLLGGLWHGAAWSFVAWGGWHGVLLAMHREWDRYWRKRNATWRASSWWRWMSRLALFHAVCLGWVFFRSHSFSAGVDVLQRLWAGTWQSALPPGAVLCVMTGIGMQYLPERLTLRLQLAGVWLQPVLRGAAFAVLLLLIEVLGPSEPAPFIYFQF